MGPIVKAVTQEHAGGHGQGLKAIRLKREDFVVFLAHTVGLSSHGSRNTGVGGVREGHGERRLVEPSGGSGRVRRTFSRLFSAL